MSQIYSGGKLDINNGEFALKWYRVVVFKIVRRAFYLISSNQTWAVLGRDLCFALHRSVRGITIGGFDCEDRRR